MTTTQEHADTLTTWAQSEDVYSQLPPEGFEEIGSGAYRVAYLGPDGRVYKLDGGYSGPYANDGEEQTYARIGRSSFTDSRGVKWRCAEMEFVKSNGWTVAVAEFINGKRDPEPTAFAPGNWNDTTPEYKAFRAILREVQVAFGIGDVHNENYICLESENVVIDLGS